MSKERIIEFEGMMIHCNLICHNCCLGKHRKCTNGDCVCEW